MKNKFNYKHNSSGFISVLLLLAIFPISLSLMQVHFIKNTPNKLTEIKSLSKISPSITPSNNPSITQNQIKHNKISPTASKVPTISNSNSTSTSNPNPTSSSSTSKPTPTPTSNTSTQSNSNPNSTCTVGFCINTKSVDLIIESGKSAKAFDITAKYDTQISLSGYPTSYGPGINWSSGGSSMSKGEVSGRNIEVNNGIEPNVYTGTVNITDNFGGKITLPMKINVTRATSSRFVTVKSPNGGETYKKDDIVNISWEGNDINKCTIDYIDSSGSEGEIASDVSTSGNGSYSWTVNISPRQLKISMLCYKTGVGQVKDEGDGLFTITN